VSDIDYENYRTIEWEMFARDEAHARAFLVAVQDRYVSSVLDIGCGAGQELRSFAARGPCTAPEGGLLDRNLFSRENPARPVIFLRSPAEWLPFYPGTFDLVICRLALEVTRSRLTIIREMPDSDPRTPSFAIERTRK
jgi:SAM-dependent methyltransferase